MDPAPSTPRLTLINPANPLVSILQVRENRWNRYRVWKPLGLAVLAGATPSGWDISIVDENLGRPDYEALPRPNLVGITAFTSQANRAYELAAHFRRLGVPVVMGGIHATTRTDEVMRHVDAAVTGEGETVWPRVLDDALLGSLQSRYDAGRADIDLIPAARHDLLPSGYAFGAVQTTRGCPLNCSFCSVTAINGAQYRQRPIPDVVREFGQVRERGVLVVDDNLIGTRPEHLARAKDLFRALSEADVHKEWIAQVTINFSDDEELMALATRRRLQGRLHRLRIAFAGRPSGSRQEVQLARGPRLPSVGTPHPAPWHPGGRLVRDGPRRRWARDRRADRTDCGELRAGRPQRSVSHPAAGHTPLASDGGRWSHPSARLPGGLEPLHAVIPVVRFARLSTAEIIQEMRVRSEHFYSLPRIARRIMGEAWGRRQPLRSLVSNLAFRKNAQLTARMHARFLAAEGLPAPR